MKNAVLGLLSLVVMVPALAAAECRRQAQITARVERRTTNSMTNCKATIQGGSIRIVSAPVSKECKLSARTIEKRGLETGLLNGHECPFYDGQVINGTAYELYQGKIYFEFE